MAAVIIRIFRFSAKSDISVHEYLKLLFIDPLQGYFYTLFKFIMFIFVITTTVVMIVEFLRRTLYSRVLVSVLEEQNRLAMTSYKRMAESEEATYSLRHEMRHHMLALTGMLKSNEVDMAREYAAAVTDEYNDLPDSQYSKNVMVNIIAGEYLSRAKALGIEVKHSLNLPESISMADTDLCVFLTNLFENALNACRKIPDDMEKYIHVKMYISGKYLFISCKNSVLYNNTDKTLMQKNRLHGYGMENMKRIAEKYGGIINLSSDASSFSVKSNFYLK